MAGPQLYSYCMPFDNGSAPNPYGGICTLVICKPGIRVTANVGDWVAGTGAKHARLGDGSTTDMSGRLVYAMKITDKMSMRDYDHYTLARLPIKVPDWTATDHIGRLGDSIYDFSADPAVQRPGVHGPGNRVADLKGENALLSAHFYYFGSNAIEVPERLQPVAQSRRGHRVKANKPYFHEFVHWIESLGDVRCQPQGKPLLDLFENETTPRWCASCRAEADELDEEEATDANPSAGKSC